MICDENIRVTVIVPPDPIVTPEDLSLEEGDTAAESRIAAVTEEIDGPGGWLGRSLGPQTLSAQIEHWPYFRLKLPYGPIIEVESVEYTDRTSGNTLALDQALYGVKDGYFWMKQGNSPSLADEPFPIRITYRAGYDGTPVEEGGTGAVPERARQAIMLSMQNLAATGAENLFLKVDEAEGIGRQEYTVSDMAGKIIQTTCDRLLGSLRVYR